MRSGPDEIRRATSQLCSGQRIPVEHVSRRGQYLIRDRSTRLSCYRDLSDTVRHLTYHVCPFANASEAWQWNIQQLLQRWDLFNGLKIIGINYDGDTVAPEAIIEYCASLGMEWDHVVTSPNCRRLGEVKTWIPSLEYLCPESALENEVVFSAHAKGVKYGGNAPPTVRDWTRVMYEVNLDYWETVRSSLEWHLATGAFRARYNRSKTCRSGVYFSGAFWWWRLHDIGQRDWRDCGQWYAGRELWIGNQATHRDETDCLFMDQSRSPYLKQYWDSTVDPKYQKFIERKRVENAQRSVCVRQAVCDDGSCNCY